MTYHAWTLPDGVEEVLAPDAWVLETLRRELIDLYRSWGYAFVLPPLIEYIESLLTGAGRELDVQTFKLTDQNNGRLMGLRADMTPQIARIDANRIMADSPARLCYTGTALRARPGVAASSRALRQIGVELFGHAGAESDREVLSLMVATLRTAGIDGFHLDLGHVGVVRALLAPAGLAPELEADVFDVLQRKSLPEAQTPALAVHVDLAELRGYHYHTGVVFAAFVEEHGRELARGGRYDYVGEAFGRGRPATGFSSDLNVLTRVANRAAAQASVILAPVADDAALHARVHELRTAGEIVVQALPGQAFPEHNRHLALIDTVWTVQHGAIDDPRS